REQLAAILFRYSGAESEGAAMGLAGYDDAGQISDWAKEALVWAVTKGIINGTSDTTLEPKGNALRAQVATMLMRYSK
ncbi:MAG: S-layer homology domain-containing protein, partial [Firmicutes bacterium]|nr:S-layer homology domain-containing protein [Bacillota bacterium]